MAARGNQKPPTGSSDSHPHPAVASASQPDSTEPMQERDLARALADAERRASLLEAVFNAIADGVYVYDRDGHLVQTNAAARTVNPLTTHPDYLAHAFDERIAPFAVRDEYGQPMPLDEIPVIRVLHGEVLAGTNAANTVMRTPSGHELLLNTTGSPVRDAAGNITGAVIVTRDVTDRWRLEQRTQDALTALLAMAQTLVRSPEPASGDSERAVTHRLAALACSVLGCQRVAIQAVEPETQVLRPVAVVGLSAEQERQWWNEQLQQQSHFGEGADPEAMARFMAGEIFMLDLTQPPYDTLPNPYGITTMLLAPMRTGGQIVGILSLDHSGERHVYSRVEQQLAEAVAQLAAIVVERERLQRERARAEARALALEETNQLMNEFLGIAGHELRTPMTSAKANVQLAAHLLRRLLGDSTGVQDVPGTLQRLHTLVTRTEQQMKRQERLVNDLLDVSRIQVGRLEMDPRPADLLAVVRDAVEEQRTLHPERSIPLIAPEGYAVVPVLIDSDRIGQVVTNLLVNALKYSLPDAPVVVSVQIEQNVARVNVRDEGPGLPPEEHPRVWEAFHQVPGIEVLSGSGIGLGLGLHISRTIVERHGGSVALESAPGTGSTFAFNLPLRREN